MIKILQSVGKHGKNRPEDVKKIQRMLNRIQINGTLEIDGACGTATINAIKRFQKRFMSNPDGVVDPGGRTLREMNKNYEIIATKWSGDSAKWSDEKKIQSLDRRIQTKIRGILHYLSEKGFQPKIVYAWRSVAVQERLYREGKSKVRFSFHNAQHKDGSPRALAVDIIDKRWAWNEKAAQNGFWQTLGEAARRHGLYWGGSWKKFKDWAHVQYFPNAKLSEIKKASGLA